MNNQVSKSTLLRAVKIIKQWHDMNDKDGMESVFPIYYNHAPEMKEIRVALGDYDTMKDLVIEATSVSVGANS